MKKSADSNNTTVTPVLCLTSQRFLPLVWNHVPAQTHVSVFLESVNETHTHKSFSQDIRLPLQQEKQPLKAKRCQVFSRGTKKLQLFKSARPHVRTLVQVFMASLHMIKIHKTKSRFRFHSSQAEVKCCVHLVPQSRGSSDVAAVFMLRRAKTTVLRQQGLINNINTGSTIWA